MGRRKWGQTHWGKCCLIEDRWWQLLAQLIYPRNGNKGWPPESCREDHLVYYVQTKHSHTGNFHYIHCARGREVVGLVNGLGKNTDFIDKKSSYAELNGSIDALTSQASKGRFPSKKTLKSESSSTALRVIHIQEFIFVGHWHTLAMQHEIHFLEAQKNTSLLFKMEFV